MSPPPDVACPGDAALSTARSFERNALIAICGAGALLRLVALRREVISDDEAIYDTIAGVIRDGGVMYRDAVDHKPPGLAYTYAAVGRLAATPAARMALVHVAGAIAAVVTALGLYAIARFVLARRLALWPPLLYLVTSICKQPADGLAVNGELLMNAPAVVAVAIALWASRCELRQRVLLDLLAGALVGVAVSYKYQAALTFAAFLPWLATDPRRALGRLSAWGVGFGVVLAAWLLYFQAHGALREAVFWGLLFNRKYIGSGPTFVYALRRFSLQIVGVLLPGALLYVAGIRTLRRLVMRNAAASADVVAEPLLLVSWALASIAAVFLGGRFFGHYFLQAEPALALLAAGPVAALFATHRARVVTALVLPAFIFTVIAAVPELSDRYFDRNTNVYTDVGRAIAERTQPDDSVWIWGNVPQLYHTSGRTPGVRFSFCNYLTGLSPATPSEDDPYVDPGRDAVDVAWPLVRRDLDEHRPRIIADTAIAHLKAYGKFPISRYAMLASYVAAHYVPDGYVDGVLLYRRVD